MQSVNSLSGRTGSALVWHTRGRVFELRLPQQVLRFVGRVCTVRMWNLGGATSQLDRQSLRPLSVAGCGRLQLGVPFRLLQYITVSS